MSTSSYSVLVCIRSINGVRHAAAPRRETRRDAGVLTRCCHGRRWSRARRQSRAQRPRVRLIRHGQSARAGWQGESGPVHCSGANQLFHLRCDAVEPQSVPCPFLGTLLPDPGCHMTTKDRGVSSSNAGGSTLIGGCFRSDLRCQIDARGASTRSTGSISLRSPFPSPSSFVNERAPSRKPR